MVVLLTDSLVGCVVPTASASTMPQEPHFERSTPVPAQQCYDLLCCLPLTADLLWTHMHSHYVTTMHQHVTCSPDIWCRHRAYKLSVEGSRTPSICQQSKPTMSRTNTPATQQHLLLYIYCTTQPPYDTRYHCKIAEQHAAESSFSSSIQCLIFSWYSVFS